ncbi:MAG: hypothetical protein HC836_33985 [Richelia sp. RM2_1_2]|nr:hypothetical protein [Richelia sp. RM1_1_1]NJO31427.1 hypothetical protein [Richelia sp. SL_2_1]NJO63053.1 hypothetical protein [Richelia sp. RM2_1_2]
MDKSKEIQVGDKVVILRPSHIAGKTGFIYAREVFSDEEISKRWIIRIDSEDVMVSLSPKEFELLAER